MARAYRKTELTRKTVLVMSDDEVDVVKRLLKQAPYSPLVLTPPQQRIATDILHRVENVSDVLESNR